MSSCRALFFFFVLPAVSVWADYAWIAKPGFLHGKIGFDYFYSTENFASDGAREDINFLNQSVDFSTNTFWIEPEYGVADDLAALFRMRIWSGNVNPAAAGGRTVASGSGVGDLDASLKWSVLDVPLSTLEFSLKVPPYQRSVLATDMLAGDGSLDFLVHYHMAFVMESIRFMLSPCIVVRSAGYPAQLRLAAAAELKILSGYFRIFADSRASLGNSILLDSSEVRHDAPGSGGSFARLSGGSTGVDLGVKTSWEVAKSYFLEGQVSHSVWGSSYPFGLTIGINLHAVWDVNVPDSRLKIRDVPLDKPADTPVDG